LTDTDKQNNTEVHKLNTTLKSKQCKIHPNKTSLVQLPLTILGQQKKWAYSTMLPSPHRQVH